MAKPKRKLNKRERRARDHGATVNSKHVNAMDKAKKKDAQMQEPPARTSHYDKKSGVYKTAGEKVNETADEITYQWTEDKGGENVTLKRRKYMKDHAKARFEGGRQYSRDGKSVTTGSWTEDCGNHCKINKDKFDEGYDEIFGKRKKGAAAGKYKKFKKKY